MVNNGLHIREQTYRSASRAFDYFVTGLSALLFLATALCFEAGQTPIVRALDAAAVVLFALAVVTGVKKLEYYVAVLGADYTIRLTETDQTNLTVRESAAVLRDLNETVEHLTNRASVVHHFRNWCLVLGVTALVGSQMIVAFSVS